MFIDSKGRSPDHPGMVWMDFEPHHGMLIATSPALPGGSLLVSYEDAQHMLSLEELELADPSGWVSDEYLAWMEVEEEDEDEPEGW